MQIHFILCLIGFYFCDAQRKLIQPPRVSYPERSGIEPQSRCGGRDEVWYPDGYCGEDCDYGFRCYDTGFCFCKSGYKRKGISCVASCPTITTCPITMVVSNCPHCAEFCDPQDTTEQPYCDSKAMKPNVLCEEGRQYCACPDGWKWFNGSCVSKCPQERCMEDGLVYHHCYNENWQQCPDYSRNRSTKSEGCYPGCFCPDGTYNFKGRCIDIQLCPTEDKTCRPGMEYRYSANPCARMCSVFLCSSYKCPPSTHEGCFCAQNTFWNDKIKACVDRSQCFADKPLVTNKSEFKCGFPHLNYCPDDTFVSSSSPTECTRGCFCLSNHLYDREMEKCVPQLDCPRVRCPRNSLLQTQCVGWDICYANLKPSCKRIFACFCKPGYKRQLRNGEECVEENKCKASP